MKKIVEFILRILSKHKVMSIRYSYYLTLCLITLGSIYMALNNYFNNRYSFYRILIGSAFMYGVIFYKLYMGYRPTKKTFNQRYIYHLTSAENIEKIKNGDMIHIKKAKGIFKNYATFGRAVSYFHTNLRGPSYFYNHLFKPKNIDYIILIPLKNLDSSKIYTRNIDKSLIYLDEYIGPGKIIKADKLRLFKGLDKSYIKYFLADLIGAISSTFVIAYSMVFLLVKYVRFIYTLANN